MSAARLLGAQIEAEVKNRLRAPSTLVALVVLFALSFLWIPDPAKNTVSIAWKGSTEGVVQTGVYNSAYIGATAAVLAALFLSLIGFYLVAGSVRRDRETGVGAILAATPLSSWAYLAGKAAAHFAYLLAVGLASVVAGVAVFWRYGVGPLALSDFLAPFLLLVAPALAFTAAVAVLFDVVPGLSGRGGQVLLFFVWTFVFLMIPVLLAGGFSQREEHRSLPVFDPTGLAAFTQQVADSMPGGRVGDISIGLMVMDRPPERVEWDGIRFSPRLVALRLLNFLWVLPVLGLAALTFDRFDPARGRKQERRHREPAVLEERAGPPRLSAVELAPITCQPGWRRSVLAEARLLWTGASGLRWPLLAAAVAAALPGQAGFPGRAALLLLLAPIVSEVGARERLAGTAGLVFAQPGAVRPLALWKAAATALFVLAFGLPALAGLLVGDAPRSLALLCGLLALASFATAASALTGGGKLFTAMWVALWYAALSGGAELDPTGVLTARSTLANAAVALAVGAGLVVAAVLVERARWART